jgi:hypothetical protein
MALLQRGRVKVFIGDKAQGMQDMGLAEKLITQAAREYEEQYGIGADITMQANHQLLSIYQILNQSENTII